MGELIAGGHSRCYYLKPTKNVSLPKNDPFEIIVDQVKTLKR